MTTETGSPAGGEAIFSTELPADAPESFDTAIQAANYFTSLKEKKAAKEPEEPLKDIPAESAEKPATAEKESAVADADPETAPSEAPDDAEPEDDLPLIEPPRSWTKEEKEEFKSYPREAQEKISKAATRYESEFRRSQNEIAETRKAVEAERVAAEQVRRQYEAQIPNLLRELESVNQAQFGDVRTMDDVVKLQSEDPFRFQAWQVHQMRLQAAKQEADRAEGHKAQERQSRRQAYESEQNKLLVELVPEMADPNKAVTMRERAVAMLNDDLGLKNEQLSRWMADDTGHEILSNAGFQKLIADGLKYRDILKAPKAVAAKPLPLVTRPGTSRPAGSDASEREQALSRKTELTVREATELYTMQQSRQRRAR